MVKGEGIYTCTISKLTDNSLEQTYFESVQIWIVVLQTVKLINYKSNLISK